jgi:mRNA interferase MazF
MVIHRGEIWWATLPAPTGSGPGYRRPVLVVQADSFNSSTINTIVIVSLTTNLRLQAAPGNVLITARSSGLPKDSVANVSQLIAIDRKLFTDFVGQLAGAKMAEVEEGLKKVLGLLTK